MSRPPEHSSKMDTLKEFVWLPATSRSTGKLEAWRSGAKFCEILQGTTNLGGDVKYRGFNLGGGLISQTFVPECVMRNRRVIQRTDLGSQTRIVLCERPLYFKTDDSFQRIERGRLLNHNLDLPMAIHYVGGPTLSFTFSSDLLAENKIDPSGLNGAFAPDGKVPESILATWLRVMWKNIQFVKAADRSVLSDFCGKLYAACLNQQRVLSDEQFIALELAWSLFAKAVIEIRLRDPDLTPELIAQECGLSRRTLYRLFENEGGVAGYTWERRLSAACRELRAPELSGLSIGDIAARAGFKRFSHFSFLFKKTFMLSAREYRLNNLSVNSSRNNEDVFGANNEEPASSAAFDSVVSNYRARLGKKAQYKIYESPQVIAHPQNNGGTNAISIAFCSLAFSR